MHEEINSGKRFIQGSLETPNGWWPPFQAHMTAFVNFPLLKKSCKELGMTPAEQVLHEILAMTSYNNGLAANFWMSLPRIT